MNRDQIFTAPAGPYNTPHTFKKKMKDYAQKMIVFAELVDGEWGIEENDHAIFNFVEKEYGLKKDDFVLILTLDETKGIFEIITQEKSQLGFKNTPEYFSSIKMVNSEELKIFLIEQKSK